MLEFIIPSYDCLQTKTGSGNDILCELSCGEGGEEEISGGVDQETPPERKALNFDWCTFVKVIYIQIRLLSSTKKEGFEF